VLRDVTYIPCAVDKPLPRRESVCHRLLGGEGLGGDQEKGPVRLQPVERLGDLCAVDVGDEMDGGAFREGTEALRDHDGAEVRSPDADVDNVGDFFARVTFPLPRDDIQGKAFHLFQNFVHLGHHVLPVYVNRGIVPVSQGDVENGPVFRFVDPVAREHFFDGLFEARLLCELDQEGERIAGDPIFRVVNEDVLETDGVFAESFGFPRKEVFHVEVFDFPEMLVEKFPGLGTRRIDFPEHDRYPPLQDVSNRILHYVRSRNTKNFR